MDGPLPISPDVAVRSHLIQRKEHNDMRARLFAVGAVAAGIALVPGVALAAPGGYGSNADTSSGAVDAPGGFTESAGKVTVDATGGGTLTASVPGASGAVSAKIYAPAGALPAGAEIIATKPDLTKISPDSLQGAGFSGYRAVAGIGVKAKNADGTDITGKFAKPITVTISGAGLGKDGEKAVMFTGATGASALPATVGTNSITITIDADPNIAVIDPTSTTTATAGTVANATSTHTGIPTEGIYAGAAALVLVGGGALMASRRRAVTSR